MKVKFFITKVEQTINKSSVSAYKLIADMERLGILTEISGAQRGRTYQFKDYIELFS